MGRIKVAGEEAGWGGICNVCKTNDGGVRSPWIIVVNKLCIRIIRVKSECENRH